MLLYSFFYWHTIWIARDLFLYYFAMPFNQTLSSSLLLIFIQPSSPLIFVHLSWLIYGFKCRVFFLTFSSIFFLYIVFFLPSFSNSYIFPKIFHVQKLYVLFAHLEKKIERIKILFAHTIMQILLNYHHFVFVMSYSLLKGSRGLF